MAKVHCTVIVYENGSIKRVILIEGEETKSNVGRVSERVFRDTLTEEIGYDYGLDFVEEDLEEALEEGHIECNGGQTEIYIVWPEKTINADKE